ncbi:IclR family transcriptional regulator domain-containing protein [Bradyrhizobium neotropicale]|uniref:IclR family transcriptional regulator domain-containing protein n=1 Tax=Bradyrhizobium neotropicale TaxID=1497615 RepID=UPI0013747A1C
MKAHLTIVRARGYAIDDEEIILGTRCVGTAILDPSGKPLAAGGRPLSQNLPGQPSAMGKAQKSLLRNFASLSRSWLGWKTTLRIAHTGRVDSRSLGGPVERRAPGR